MNYLANLNKNHLMSFLVLSIGALILGLEDRSGISAHYYITDRDFTIKQGGIINVEYGVKQNDSYLSGGLLPVTVEFGGSATTDTLDYGVIPFAANQSYMSVCAWIYLDSDPGVTVRYSIANLGGGLMGWYFTVRNGQKLAYTHAGDPGSTGEWLTAANALSLDAWHHVAFTRDNTNINNVPILYIDGSAIATTGAAQIGVNPNETGGKLMIGNLKNPYINYTWGLDGKIFDPRVYNRILTAAEVTALYNAGVPDETLVTDGLVFQGMSTYADNPLAAGRVLTSTDRLVENIVRAVGVPHGAPIIRANP